MCVTHKAAVRWQLYCLCSQAVKLSRTTDATLFTTQNENKYLRVCALLAARAAGDDVFTYMTTGECKPWCSQLQLWMCMLRKTHTPLTVA